MMLVQITGSLYVNPERVVSVEWREVTRGEEQLAFTELTLETMVRWRLELGLEEVVTALQGELR